MAVLESSSYTINWGNSSDGDLTYFVEKSGSSLIVALRCRTYTAGSPVYRVSYNGSTKSITNSSTIYNGGLPGTYYTTFTYNSNCTSVSITGTLGRYTLYFGESGSQSTLSISWINPNTAPTVSFGTLPAFKAGKTAKISWTTSDSDGDSVSVSSLYRYLKKSGASSYTSTRLYPSGNSYTDTIPDDAGGGSVYYKITVSDGKATASATSATKTVEKGTTINGSLIIGGVSKELVGAYVNIGGARKEITGSYVNIGGVWKQTF